MQKHINPENLIWICRPGLFVQTEDRLVIETEPFTDLRPAGGSAEAVELSLSPHGSFCFTTRVDFHYRGTFDQCGLILYARQERKAIFGTEYRDAETMRMHCTVFHGRTGDRSVRDVGSSINHMYYRIWYRGGAVRLQYSFTGERYSDFREFQIKPSEDPIQIGIYACSPANSFFDCTFRQMTLEEDSFTTEEKE